MSIIIQFMRSVAPGFLLLGIVGFSAGSQAWEGHKLAPWVGTMLNGTKCDGGQVPFGPYDYLQRDQLKAQLEVVEESHFNEDVESLAKGMSASAMGDIHYTLQTWPNHHRALNSALRFRLQHRGLWNSGANTAQNYPAECYLQRAMKFSPNDPIPYMLHGLLMHQMKKYEAALKSYRQAVKLRPDDLITQYNMGLTLVELKMYEEAQKVADKVYAAEFPLPGLNRKLAEAKRPKTNAPATSAEPNKPVVAGTEHEKPADTRPQSSVPQESTAQKNDTNSVPAEAGAQQAPADSKLAESASTPESAVEPRASVQPTASDTPQ